MANCEAIYIDSRLGLVQCHDTEFHKGEHRADEMISLNLAQKMLEDSDIKPKGKPTMVDLGKMNQTLKQRIRQAINDLRAKGEILSADAVWDLWDFYTELVVENEALQEQVKELRSQLEEKKKSEDPLGIRSGVSAVSERFIRPISDADFADYFARSRDGSAVEKIREGCGYCQEMVQLKMDLGAKCLEHETQS